MPLSEDERRKLATLMDNPATNGLLPEIAAIIQGLPASRAYPSSISAKGMRMLVPAPTREVERDLLLKQAEQLLKAKTPVPTESERASTKVAGVALENLARIKQLIGAEITGKNAQGRPIGTVKNRKPITVYKLTPEDYLGQLMSPTLSPDAKALRSDLNSAIDLIAMLRTGKAGESVQQARLMAERNIGETDQTQTILDRISALEDEIKGFASGKIASPLDQAGGSDGGVLHVDKLGRKAMVYPDGTYQRVP